MYTPATRADQIKDVRHRISDRFGALPERVDRLVDIARDLRNQLVERRYRARPGAYLGRIVRRARLLSQDELDDLLEPGIAAGALDERDADSLRLSDLIVRGRRQEDDAEVLLVVEVSAGIGQGDVLRAQDRAQLLRRVSQGRETVPVVAGEWISPTARSVASQVGVQVAVARRPRPSEDELEPR